MARFSSMPSSLRQRQVVPHYQSRDRSRVQAFAPSRRNDRHDWYEWARN
jgi:hypothetical protein